jgi:hypothetical protein
MDDRKMPPSMANMASQMIDEMAEEAFNDMMSVIEKHGTCFFRFDIQRGLLIINPKHYPKINGVIADA